MTNQFAEPLNGTDRYAVLGNPIAHSKSPLIHAAFAKQTQQNISYERVLAPLDGFEAKVRELIAQGYKGANVTVPFKFEAFALCDDLSDSAKAAGAVNTLIFNKNRIKGDNTDGFGLTQDIQHNNATLLDNKRVLLLGAGGAAAGVLLPLLLGMPASITIANRTQDKAENLVENIRKSKVFKSSLIPPLVACTYDALKNQTFDIVVNATSAGISNEKLSLPSKIFTSHTLAYEMMYGVETFFMKQAMASGAVVADGLGMLVEQAAEAFAIWRGVRPETAPVIKALRDGTLV